MKLQKENKFKKIIFSIVLAAGIVGGATSAADLINELATSNQQIEMVTEAINPNYEDSHNVNISEESEPEEFESKYDFEKLQETNPNIVGVIEGDCFEGGYYPVVGTTSFEEENYYLHHAVDGRESNTGSIISDFRNDNTMQSDVTTLWGHNMGIGQGGSMFSSLTNYSSQEYYNEHPTLKYYTPTGEYVLEIFAYVEDDPSQHLVGNYNDDENFVNEMNNIINNSMIDTGINITEDDRVIRLICCTKRGSQFDENRTEVYARLTPVKEISLNSPRTK